MPRRAKELTAAKVRTAKPGRLCDGAATGLYLLVKDQDRKYWLFRYTPRGGKMREMGLGPAVGPATVSLAEARGKARELHRKVREGIDPLDDRQAVTDRRKAEEAIARASSITFEDVAQKYLDAHEGSWRSHKHRIQWTGTLRDYVLPVIGSMPIAAIDTGHVMSIIEPLWKQKTETASRVRGRIESILNFAKARGWREGENAARWKGHLDHLLPARRKAQTVKHHRALPWRELPTFVEYLRGYPRDSIAANALFFTILTAARSGEILGAQWSEIDLATKVWTIPAHRMKAGRIHRVPLSEECITILQNMPRLAGDGRVFPISAGPMAAILKRAGLDVTIHGMRSTFRDWCAEATNYPRECAEISLAHAVGSAVEIAYQRSDMLIRRRRLMQDWSTFCTRPVPVAEVLQMLERRK